jgi:hypothetical protein
VITDYWPKLGQQSGGTVVTIAGQKFDPSLGGFKCKFGSIEVDAILVELLLKLQCVSPAASTGTASFSVSIDGGKKYFGIY